MLSKIIGILWILLGVLWLIKPGMLKNRLTRKMNRKMRFFVYGLIIIFAGLILGIMFKTPGMPVKIAGIVAIMVLIRFTLLITAKASGKVGEWLAAKPIMIFRIWAGIILATGLFLFLS